jgi:hypothetical protein
MAKGKSKRTTRTPAKGDHRVRASGRESNAVTSRRTGMLADQLSPRVAKIDERYVGETDQTVPVRPRKRSGVPDHPDVEAALDQRRQIVGTDEPKQPTRRRKGGR